MKFFSHIAAALLEGALVATIVLVLVVGTALAGKPTGGGGGHKGGGGTTGGGSATISLHKPLDVDLNGNGTPNWSDVVSFDISTSEAKPFVHLMCTQNGSLVAQGWDGYFDGALGGRTFGLSSPSWTGGAASCKANVETGTGAVLGSMTFSVGA
jgi:hypothetical protein